MSIENTTDTTDSSNAKGDGSTEQNSTTNTLEAKTEAVDEAIDEAIKNETEKLYEEACSIVSSGTFCTGSY